MRTFTISLGQMTPRLGQAEANFAQLREWAAEAAQRGSEMVLFPELWSTGGDLANWEHHAAPLGAGLFAEMANLAAELGVATEEAAAESAAHELTATEPAARVDRQRSGGPGDRLEAGHTTPGVHGRAFTECSVLECCVSTDDDEATTDGRSRWRVRGQDQHWALGAIDGERV